MATINTSDDGAAMSTTLEKIRQLSDRIGALTGAGPAFLYSTAPTPGTFRVVLSDGGKYTEAQAWARLNEMLADVEAGQGWFYCRMCKDATQRTRSERDEHEQTAHKRGALRRAGLIGLVEQ